MQAVKNKYIVISFLLLLIVCGVARFIIPKESITEEEMPLSEHSKKILELNIGVKEYRDLYYYADEKIVNEYIHWFDVYQIALKQITMHKKVGSLRIKRNRAIISKQYGDIIRFLQSNQELLRISRRVSSSLKDETYQISPTLSFLFLLRLDAAEINQKKWIEKVTLFYSDIKEYETRNNKILIAEACRDFMDSEELINYIRSIDDLNMSIYEIIREFHNNSLNN